MKGSSSEFSFVDEIGREVTLQECPPKRVISLVPSWTEWLFDAGYGETVVGVTDFCEEPADKIMSLPKVGSVKNPSVQKIRDLNPDLIIGNKEENRKETVEEIELANIPIVITYPVTVKQAVESMFILDKLFNWHSEEKSLNYDRLLSLRESVNDYERVSKVAASPNGTKFVGLIWKDPYMTFGLDTYVSDILRLCGGFNCFSGHSPVDTQSSRYFEVTKEGIEEINPEVIFLPDEPFRFTEKDKEEILSWDTPASRNGHVYLCDGKAFTWYGFRIEKNLPYLAKFLKKKD